ncbi:MAG: tRNA nucleotidyltransferase [Bacteroidetes bacterium GWF2_38_335]|nr:MAG: tRNA nucleotidyltransferase [Bacteroidetes bacterium GWF2_38_335]OFY80539.1 MAG: tRNA nucleotidyltransferase [Bacteroidetes bacterium RIFOXYA12_FULL_38_20]HBS85850.1 tRNA nucleotidyltransferase [Bacteroidales bacterium]
MFFILKSITEKAKAMKEHLNNRIFSVISEIVGRSGQECYVIGGFVRDLFLNRPSKDIDIVVIGSGIELAEKVARQTGQKGCVTVFRNFGTAMLRFEDMEIEFVGARRESYQRNSRKPIVENGSLQDDQNRRDFTINALALSLRPENFGELVDPFGGMDDLKNRIIKTPLDPGITFSDDPLRMLRCIRFACRLNFIVEERTFAALHENRERIEIISKERISEELNKILMTDKPSVGFLMLDKCGLLELIFPELYQMKGIERREGKAHKDNFLHSLQVLDNICGKTDNLWLRWAALLHDIAKPKTKKYHKVHGWTFHGHELAGSKMVTGIFNDLKLPLNQHMKYVQKLVMLHLRPISLVEEIVTDSAVRRLLFDAGDDVDDLMTLAEADITSGNPEKVERFLKNFALVREKLKEVEEKDSLRNWQPPVSGELIMETFGIAPCREVGMIKNAIREAILDGIIENNFDAAYKFMIETGRGLGLEPGEQ